MIRINKSPNIPAILLGRGMTERTDVCTKYSTNPPVFRIKYNKTTNPFKLAFKNDVYGHSDVKTQLIADQHGKCCFCEGDFLEHSFGDVEHYRPKGGYKQNNTDPIGKPGYYWLAYHWDNLMFSCEICNRKFKKNLFPITAGTARACEHTDPIESLNDCLLIDPNSEDPQMHISFNLHVPIGHTPKGKKSITVYGLKRSKLNEAREKHLKHVQANLFLSKIDLNTLSPEVVLEIMEELNVSTMAELQQIIDTAITFRNNCAKSSSPFANMVRSKYPNLPT